jgi:hypothetical protein
VSLGCQGFLVPAPLLSSSPVSLSLSLSRFLDWHETVHGSHAMAAAEPPNSCGHPPLHVRPCAVRRRPATRLRSHVLSLPRGPHGLSPAAPGTEFPESLRGSSLPRGRKFKIFKSSCCEDPVHRGRQAAAAGGGPRGWCTRFASQSRVNERSFFY